MAARVLYNFFAAVGVIALSLVAQADPCKKFDERTFTPQSLIAEVTRKDSEIRSVEDLLCRLPESFLSTYVLVSESRSLQEGTPDAPRAIVFDPNSSPRTFLSFNGKPGQIGFFHIEMINETTDNRFINFTDINFVQCETHRDVGRHQYATPDLSHDAHARLRDVPFVTLLFGVGGLNRVLAKLFNPVQAQAG